MNCKRKEIITIPHCPHGIQEWLIAHPDIAKHVGDKIADYSKFL